MHIWWRNKISRLSKVEKAKDLVGVKGGGESNLCLRLPAAWETKRGESKRRHGGGSLRGAEGEMDGWHKAGLMCRREWASIERTIRVTVLDLIDIRTELFLNANRHITLVCKLLAEQPTAKGLFNIHERAFKSVRRWCPPSAATTACFPTCLCYQHIHTHTRITFHSHARHATCRFLSDKPWPDEKLSSHS